MTDPMPEPPAPAAGVHTHPEVSDQIAAVRAELGDVRGELAGLRTAMEAREVTEQAAQAAQQAQAAAEASAEEAFDAKARIEALEAKIDELITAQAAPAPEPVIVDPGPPAEPTEPAPPPTEQKPPTRKKSRGWFD